MIQVLTVTNDMLLDRMLKVTLTINGFAVKSVFNFNEVGFMLQRGVYNILLVDMAVDEAECVDFFRWLREQGNDVPVLFFGKPRHGYSFNGCDYLAKPFTFTELKSKMNKLLRRRTSLSEKIIVYGDLQIDVGHQIATVKDKILSLGKTELALLVSLARKTGSIVSRDSMREDLEAQGIFFNTTTFYHISLLKRKLREVAGEAFKVRTVTGRGYQLLLG